MKRWSDKKEDHIERPKIDKFLTEIDNVCIKHGLSISHEDGHGAFKIVVYNRRDAEWLQGADDAR